MKILALERDPDGAPRATATPELLRAEAATAWDLQQSGCLRELYFRGDRPQAVLVLECASADEARRRLGELPLVHEGLIDFEVIPLVAYPGFARLFAP
ncbi:MAG: muconolactone Delta-isomerase family protein [Candidatus Dormibacteria bacterium]